MIKIGAASITRLKQQLTFVAGTGGIQALLMYLLGGVEPGSFYTGVIKNEFNAILHSHPSNSIESLKSIVRWMQGHWPAEAYGSADAFNRWTRMSDEQRRAALVDAQMIFTPKVELLKSIEDPGPDQIISECIARGLGYYYGLELFYEPAGCYVS